MSKPPGLLRRWQAALRLPPEWGKRASLLRPAPGAGGSTWPKHSNLREAASMGFLSGGIT
eukprot:5781795-Alexandrium_andersonii.AAC.1